MSTVLPTWPCDGGSFAERLRRVGAEFDWEVRQSIEATARAAQREARVLHDEVDWLQRQLEDERHQSAARLGLCAELQRQLEEAQDAHQREVEAREFWQRACASFEQKHGLLEAKLEALVLTEAENAAAAAAAAAATGPSAAVSDAPPGAWETPRRSSRDGRGSPGSKSSSGATDALHAEEGAASRVRGRALAEGPAAEGEAGEEAEVGERATAAWRESGEPEAAEEAEPLLECGGGGDPADLAAVERCLRVLEEDSGIVAERRLRRLSMEGVHALLLGAAVRQQGAAALIHCVVRLWVGRLLCRRAGAALRAAVGSGSLEALGALLSLGGAGAAAAAAAGGCGAAAAPGSARAAPARASASGQEGACLLSLCDERGDGAMLAQLLEHLRGAGSRVLGGVRRARGLAASLGRAELTAALTTHLVVELSLLGNERYRRGAFEEAIPCYQEAIGLVEEDARHAGLLSSDAMLSPQEERERCHFAGDGGVVCPAHAVAGAARDNLVRLRYNLGRALHRTDRWAEAREQATALLVMDPGYVNAYALRAQAAMAALDWPSAQADWDRLMAISAVGRAGSAAPQIADEVVDAWKRRREECQRHLALTHYEVLELPKLASLEAVRRAYRDLARRWHPDKHQHRSRDHQERSSRRFSRVREAYEALSDEASKRAYDALLLLREARPPSPGPGGEAGPGTAGRAPTCGGSASVRPCAGGPLPSQFSRARAATAACAEGF